MASFSDSDDGAEYASFEADGKEEVRREYYTLFGSIMSKVVGETVVKYVGNKLGYEYDAKNQPVGLTYMEHASLAKLNQDGLLRGIDEEEEEEDVQELKQEDQLHVMLERLECLRRDRVLAEIE